MIKVSIILTTYNAESTLGRLFQSILNQQDLDKNFSLEWLVVDDCSTDKTTNILEEFSIPYIQNKTNSGGPNKGRNLALQKATGDYITIVDDDDLWEPDKIKQLLSCAQHAPIVSSGYFLQDVKKNTTTYIGNKSTDCKQYAANESFQQIIQRSYRGQITYIGSLLFSSSIPIPSFEMEFGKADWDWVAKLFENNKSVEVCKPLYTRIVDDTNLSLNEKYRKQELTNSLHYLQTIAHKYPNLAKTGVKNSYGSMAKYYYATGKMEEARNYFLKGPFTIKNILYYLTTFFGHQWVNKYFKVFG